VTVSILSHTIPIFQRPDPTASEYRPDRPALFRVQSLRTNMQKNILATIIPLRDAEYDLRNAGIMRKLSARDVNSELFDLKIFFKEF
jgi:hypothetical protein